MVKQIKKSYANRADTLDYCCPPILQSIANNAVGVQCSKKLPCKHKVGPLNILGHHPAFYVFRVKFTDGNNSFGIQTNRRAIVPVQIIWYGRE
jgi:hypothetical protein